MLHVQFDLADKSAERAKKQGCNEEVDPGLINSAEDVYTEYEDRRRDEWETKIRPALNEISLPILEKKQA